MNVADGDQLSVWDQQLHASVQTGNVEEVCALLRCQTTRHERRMLLYRNVIRDDSQSVHALLRFWEPDDCGDNLLHSAVKHNASTVCRILLAEHSTIDVNGRDNYNQTPLGSALKKFNWVIVDMLLADERTDVNAVTDELAPLQYASATGDISSVRKLLAHPRTNVNAVTITRCYTALQFAVYFCHSEIVDLLLAHPTINVNQNGMNGTAALHLSACKNCLRDLQSLLQRADIEVDARDYNNQTPLQGAYAHGQVKHFELLLKAGADWRQRTFVSTKNHMRRRCQLLIECNEEQRLLELALGFAQLDWPVLILIEVARFVPIGNGSFCTAKQRDNDEVVHSHISCAILSLAKQWDILKCIKRAAMRH